MTSPAPTRRELLTAFRGGEGDAPLPHWPWIEIADRCTLCATCVDSCPQGAIKKFTDSGLAGLTFTPGRCDSCRACLSSCSRAAITLGEEQLTVPFKERDVITFTTRACTTCQAPTVHHTQCEWCRGNGVVDERQSIINSMRQQRKRRQPESQ